MLIQKFDSSRAVHGEFPMNSGFRHIISLSVRAGINTSRKRQGPITEVVIGPCLSRPSDGVICQSGWI
jgi:hypothetical protein